MSHHVERVLIGSIQVGDLVWCKLGIFFIVNSIDVLSRTLINHIQLRNMKNRKLVIQYDKTFVLRASQEATQTTITVREVPLSQIRLDDVVWSCEGQDWLQVKNIRKHETIDNDKESTREVTKLELNGDDDYPLSPFLEGEPDLIVLVK